MIDGLTRRRVHLARDSMTSNSRRQPGADHTRDDRPGNGR
jgi:hypothetical protein